MQKTKAFPKRILALLMVLMLCMGMLPVGAKAAGEAAILTFTWRGTEYSVKAGASGSASGISWSCDVDGNLSMVFTGSGEFSVVKGVLDSASVEVIGGGAGGSSAGGNVNNGFEGNGFGGNGGGGGSVVTSAVTITEGETITVTVGHGGRGGVPSSTEMAYYTTASSGESGGSSAFGSITAAGGAPDGGGSGAVGVGPGGDGSGNSGGGGGSVHTLFETDCANYSFGNYSCHICGTNSGYYDYGRDGWTPLYQNASDPGNVSGGRGSNGGGNGGSPENEHGHGPRTGGNGTDGTGGGGGGGAFASRVYQLGIGEGYSRFGSAEFMGFSGPGGNGGSGKVTLTAHVNPKMTISLTKTSANTSMTSGNSCYSLEGAVYGIYSDRACTALVQTMTTNANGYAQSDELDRGSYYVKEISPSRGYLLDNTVYTANEQSNELTVKENPANDPVGITIDKISLDTASTVPSLAGTQFTVSFYAGQYSSIAELPAAARTWILEVHEAVINGETVFNTRLNAEHKVGGDDFYYGDNGIIVLPLGTITIQETKPADGYTMIGGFGARQGETLANADGLILLHVTEDHALASGGRLDYGNEYLKEDKPIYGGVSVQKFDHESGEPKPQGKGSFDGIELAIVSLNEADITVDGEVFSYGETILTGQTDEGGLFATATDLLPAGNYKIVELSAPQGYTMNGKTEAAFTVTEDGVLVTLNSAEASVSDKPIRADFSLIKQDGDTQKPMAGVQFRITSMTTDESHTFSTDAAGVFDSSSGAFRFGADGDGGALLYDTYIIEELECAANKGYVMAAPIQLEIIRSNVSIQIQGVYNYQMRMQTTAKFTPSGEKWSASRGEVTVRDSVSYENLIVGTEYRLVGKLYNKSTGEFLKGADNAEITSEKAFTPTSRSGVQTMDFRFESSQLAGQDVVVFEYLYTDGRDTPILTHEDSEDAAQTVHFPSIGTSAVDAATETTFSINTKEITVTDTVSYTNLQPGVEHTLKGTLMDKETGEPALDAAGHEITAESKFTPSSADGEVKLDFTFSGGFSTGKTFVVFEKVYCKAELMAAHEDIQDEAQTIYIPRIGTTAKAESTGTNLSPASEQLTVVDTVAYEGLKTGLEYTVRGRLVLKSDPETVLAEAEQSFTADDSSGSVDLSFTLDTSALAGKTAVAFEAIYCGETEIAAHADLEDEGQSIHIPEIDTSATDKANGSHLSMISDSVSIVDTVSYKNLVPGKEYTVCGVLMDKATGEAALDADGHEITAQTVFTPTKANGSVEIEFTFAGRFETARKLVAFEELFYEEVSLAVHSDLEDEAQTVYIPIIKTSAVSPDTESHLGGAGRIRIVDTVSYEGLIPGLTYLMSGRVVDAEAPGTILGGALTSFTPETESGSIDLEFTIDTSDYRGKTIVVFEELSLDGSLIAVHTDAEDAEQQLFIPTIKTELLDADARDHYPIAKEKHFLIDTVSFENLIPGVEYTLAGTLVLKSDPDRIIAEAEKRFTPEESSGTVDMRFEFDATNLAGETVVAFEELRYKDILIISHADIEDEAQSVFFPQIHTSATVNGKHVVMTLPNVVLIDTVSYTNLQPGMEYVLKGTVMDKATGKPIKGATATAKFTPEERDGKTFVQFELDTRNMDGKKLVVFETLELNGKIICEHKDLEDAGQTVSVTSAPITGDESNIGLYIGVALAALAGLGGVGFALYKTKKKKRDHFDIT